MKRLCIAILAAGLLAIAGRSYAVTIQETVEMITHADLVMKDGGTMHADVVKMNGKMYIMVPVDDLPDYLHQQILKVMP